MGILDAINDYNEVVQKRTKEQEATLQSQKEEIEKFTIQINTIVKEVIVPFVNDKIKELSDAKINAVLGQSVQPITYADNVTTNSFSIMKLGGMDFQFDITGASFNGSIIIHCLWSIPNRKSEKHTIHIPIDTITKEVLDAKIAEYLKSNLK